MLFACCSPVVVFPHHLGPTIRVAPKASSLNCNSRSTIRGRYLIIVYGLKKLGPTTNAVYSNFQPVTAAFFGALLLGETITWLQIIGGIIVIAAGFIVIWEKGKIDASYADRNETNHDEVEEKEEN